MFSVRARVCVLFLTSSRPWRELWQSDVPNQIREAIVEDNSHKLPGTGPEGRISAWSATLVDTKRCDSIVFRTNDRSPRPVQSSRVRMATFESPRSVRNGSARLKYRCRDRTLFTLCTFWSAYSAKSVLEIRETIHLSSVHMHVSLQTCTFKNMYYV